MVLEEPHLKLAMTILNKTLFSVMTVPSEMLPMTHYACPRLKKDPMVSCLKVALSVLMDQSLLDNCGLGTKIQPPSTPTS